MAQRKKKKKPPDLHYPTSSALVYDSPCPDLTDVLSNSKFRSQFSTPISRINKAISRIQNYLKTPSSNSNFVAKSWMNLGFHGAIYFSTTPTGQSLKETPSRAFIDCRSAISFVKFYHELRFPVSVHLWSETNNSLDVPPVVLPSPSFDLYHYSQADFNNHIQIQSLSRFPLYSLEVLLLDLFVPSYLRFDNPLTSLFYPSSLGSTKDGNLQSQFDYACLPGSSMFLFGDPEDFWVAKPTDMLASQIGMELVKNCIRQVQPGVAVLEEDETKQAINDTS